MQPNEYQELTEKTEIYTDAARIFAELPRGEIVLYSKVNYCTMKLNGEAGEIAEKVGKRFRDAKGAIGDEEFRQDMLKELGDVQWYIARLADLFGFTLEEVMEFNISKLKDRQDRNVLSGSGDER